MDQQSTLSMCEAMIAYRSLEWGVFIDKEGTILLPRSGRKDEINYSDSEINNSLIGHEKNIFTHNHPDDNRISYWDIKTLCHIKDLGADIIEIRAVSKDRIYSIKPLNNKWPSEDDFDIRYWGIFRTLNDIILESETFKTFMRENNFTELHARENLLRWQWLKLSDLCNLIYEEQSHMYDEYGQDAY